MISNRVKVGDGGLKVSIQLLQSLHCFIRPRLNLRRQVINCGRLRPQEVYVRTESLEGLFEFLVELHALGEQLLLLVLDIRGLIRYGTFLLI